MNVTAMATTIGRARTRIVMALSSRCRLRWLMGHRMWDTRPRSIERVVSSFSSLSSLYFETLFKLSYGYDSFFPYGGMKSDEDYVLAFFLFFLLIFNHLTYGMVFFFLSVMHFYFVLFSLHISSRSPLDFPILCTSHDPSDSCLQPSTLDQHKSNQIQQTNIQ